MNCCTHNCNQGRDCPARAAIVAPIKVQRRTCDALGICQGHPNACAGCSPQEQADTESDLAALNDMPLDTWERIWLYGIVGIASVCTVVVLCGSASWAYHRFIT